MMCSLSLTSAADQGLQKLIEGNQRFERGEACFSTVCKEALAELAKGQQPFATILGCSDSRVPPELIFDANFGELFIVRVAGNVISPEVMGSSNMQERICARPSLSCSVMRGAAQ